MLNIGLKVCIVFFAWCALTGCGQRPLVKVKASASQGQVVFGIDYSGINRLLRFTVLDQNGQMLWEIKIAGENISKITYGVVPRSDGLKCVQVFPADGGTPS